MSVPNYSRPFCFKPLALTLAVALISLLTGCSRSAQNSGTSNSPEPITSSKPPFQTKEPERYQAIRVITTTEGQTGTVTLSRSIRIARDGTNRREEYETDGKRIVYLENSNGSFVLFPSAKIYADLNMRSGNEVSIISGSDTAQAMDALINQTSTQATYRKLGTEQLGERSTTKYRVSYVTKTGGTTPTQETYVWVDESLGMPIRSETSYVSASHSSRVLTELREISLEVDARQFALPPDYKSVTYAAIHERIRAARSK